MSQRDSWQGGFRNFLFPTESDLWLTTLRCGLGLQVCLYCLWLRKDWDYFLAGGGRGLVGRQVSEALIRTDASWAPNLSWLIDGAEHLGLSEEQTLFFCWLALFLAGVFLFLGFLSRAAAIVAWFLHLCAAKSGGLFAYGVDSFMTIGLFYLMLAPLPGRYALDGKIWAVRAADSELLGFFRRLLQVHLGIAYFFGGLCKALGSGWWDGSNMWRAFIRPPFGSIPPELVLPWKELLPILGIGIVVLEIGYPLMMSMKKTRLLWLALILAMHVAIGVTMGMYLFALVMIVLNIAAFGPRTERKPPAPQPL